MSITVSGSIAVSDIVAVIDYSVALRHKSSLIVGTNIRKLRILCMLTFGSFANIICGRQLSGS